MIWKLEELARWTTENSAYISGAWVPTRPVTGPFLSRARAAWAVLMGHADAFTWPGGQ